jgi:hypothetical protein
MQSSKCIEKNGKNEKNERSTNISIKKNLSTMIKINYPKSEYSMKQNLFDPSKSSPPNDFMNKLQKRITFYSNIYVDKMDDSLDNE